MKMLEKAGGAAYIRALHMQVPTLGNVLKCAAYIQELSLERNFKLLDPSLFTEPQTLAISSNFKKLQQQILSNPELPLERETWWSDRLTVEFLDSLEKHANDPSLCLGIESGLAALDQITGGFKEGELIVVAGKPSSGKTAFAINVASHVAFNLGLPVLFFSLELQRDQLIQRVVTSLGNLDLSRLSKGTLHDQEWPNLSDVIELMRSGNMLIRDSALETVGVLRSIARYDERYTGKFGLIVVDGAQLLMGSAYAEDDEIMLDHHFTHLAIQLKMMAKEMRCPVLVTNHVSGALTTSVESTMAMADLGPARKFEIYADTMIFIHRALAPRGCESSGAEPVQLELVKHRGGPTVTIDIGWSSTRLRFECTY